MSGFSRGVSVALVVATCAGLGCRRRAADENTERGAELMSVNVEIARLQTLRVTVSGSGLVTPSPAGDWTIYPPETGRVVELTKAEGEAVKPGDVLVRFEYGNLAADVSAREAEITSTTRRLEAAEAQLAKVSSLYERGFAARNDLESAKNAVASAQLDLARAKQQLQAANTAAEHAVVKARFAGIVAKRYHSEGDLVNGSMADPVLRVVDPTHLQIAISVPVQDAAQLQSGQSATIISANGVEPGTVLVSSAPSDPKATTQEVHVGFVNPTTLPMDTPVQVDILVAERPNVVAMPSVAILKGADAAPYVMVAGVDGRAHRREVRVGLTARDRTEIITGITPGDRVIIKDVAQVPEGTPVQADR